MGNNRHKEGCMTDKIFVIYIIVIDLCQNFSREFMIVVKSHTYVPLHLVGNQNYLNI